MTNWALRRRSVLALLYPANPAFWRRILMRKGNPTRPRGKPDKEKAFEETIKGAKVSKGLFTLYQADEKVFLEIQPNQLDKMYILSLTCESGLGEGGFYAAEMCGQSPVTFHEEGMTVQLVAKNTRFVAREDLPIQRA